MSDALPHLPDTTALVDFAKGFEPARSRVLDLFDHGHEVAVCSVTVAEFFTGLTPPERERWRQFFAALPYWHITIEAARQAGIWRYEFARRGIQLATTDVLVAATAWQRQAVLVTNNVKHYPMKEVRLMSARD